MKIEFNDWWWNHYFSIGEPFQVDIGTLVIRDVVASDIPWWPRLRFLDIAGNALNFHNLLLTIDHITKFISMHPDLVFISILDTCLNRHPYHYPYERDKPLQVRLILMRNYCVLYLWISWIFYKICYYMFVMSVS